MQGIDLLIEEHRHILRFTELVRKRCCGLLEGEEVNCDEMREFILFGRNYADKHHHGKEEKVLFSVMREHLGPVAQHLVQNGMLVEHDLGRLHVGEWEKAVNQYEEHPSTNEKLNIIVNAVGYANLLGRHIDKEDNAVYTSAERFLSDELKEYVEQKTVEFERAAKDQGVQEKYLAWLDNKLKED